MASETCLLTGAAGFIGSHLAERLIEDDHQVIGVDSFTDFYPRWIKEENLARLRGHERFFFVEADLLNLDLAALLRGELTLDDSRGGQTNGPGPVSHVFHLAAQAGVRDS